MLVIEKFLVCSGCGQTYGVDTRHKTQTAIKLRASAKTNGWIYKDKKDYCSKCKMKI